METHSIEIPARYYHEPFLNRLDGAILSRKSKNFHEPLRLWINSHKGVIRTKHETEYLRIEEMFTEHYYSCASIVRKMYAEFDNIDDLLLFKLTWL